MDAILDRPALDHAGAGGAGDRDDFMQGIHAQAFRSAGGVRSVGQNPCRFVGTLATRPARRRLAIGRAATGEPVLAPREQTGATRCVSTSTRFTRAAGPGRRAVLAFHALLARR